jgi:4-hydroxybenzoate polyprenyltransferase
VNNRPPLCVDLDGSLIYGDLLHETSLALAKKRPWCIPSFAGWLFRGKAHLKQRIAEHIDIDPALLPYNQDLLSWLREQRNTGRKLILCTASDQKYANAVAEHLGIFDEVMASDGNVNLSNANKQAALVSRFGDKGFDYVGNSSADIEVWSSAGQAIVVGNKGMAQRAARVSSVDQHFHGLKPTLATWARALRLHQWLKNLLLFLPLLGSHRWLEPGALFQSLSGFLAFGLCASAVYLLNDLLDIESDRRHPRKRTRAFAAGELSVPSGIIASAILFLSALSIAVLLNEEFLAWLFTYAALTTTYSFFLKQFPLVDCLALAGLYTLRIVAGGAVISQPLSFWLLAFSLFLFLSLAFIKRYSELVAVVKAGKNSAHGRGYRAEDQQLLQSIGLASGFSSALVMALYLNSEQVLALYRHPQTLWFTMPVLLFWICWVWLKASRDEMHDDPVVFAVRDPASLVSGLIFIAVLWAAA